MYIHHYRPSAADIWTGRIDDSSDPLAMRMHQALRCADIRTVAAAQKGRLSFAFFGFSCDAGVQRNQGRVGAAEGPVAIRKELAKLPANFIDYADIIDLGDIVCTDDEMEQAQADLSTCVSHALDLGYYPLVLGGGHEIVLGHYRGLREHILKTEERAPLLINLDAHLDLRNFEQGGTSGTSFYQISEEHKEMGQAFDYICIGTQTSGNTRRLYQRADELGVSVFDAKDISLDTADVVLKSISERLTRCKHIYLTLDMDVLNAASAPGVSSPQPFGMDPNVFLYLVKAILATGKVRSIDIAEVAPRYDADFRTAKLAAVVLYAIINRLSGIA